MRGKRAKALRQGARDATVGMHIVDYSTPRQMVRQVERGYDKWGNPVHARFHYSGAMKMVPNCTRAVYKKMKRAYRALKARGL